MSLRILSLSCSICASIFSAAFAFAFSSNTRLLSFSSSIFLRLRFSRRRKETVASTTSPPASDATTRRGTGGSHVPVRDCPPRRLGAPAGRPGRVPGRGAFSLRGASYVSCTSPSLGPFTTLGLRTLSAVVEGRRQLHGNRRTDVTMPCTELAIPATSG